MVGKLSRQQPRLLMLQALILSSPASLSGPQVERDLCLSDPCSTWLLSLCLAAYCVRLQAVQILGFPCCPAQVGTSRPRQYPHHLLYRWRKHPGSFSGRVMQDGKFRVIPLFFSYTKGCPEAQQRDGKRQSGSNNSSTSHCFYIPLDKLLYLTMPVIPHLYNGNNSNYFAGWLLFFKHRTYSLNSGPSHLRSPPPKLLSLFICMIHFVIPARSLLKCHLVKDFLPQISEIAHSLLGHTISWPYLLSCCIHWHNTHLFVCFFIRLIIVCVPSHTGGRQ